MVLVLVLVLVLEEHLSLTSVCRSSSLPSLRVACRKRVWSARARRTCEHYTLSHHTDAHTRTHVHAARTLPHTSRAGKLLAGSLSLFSLTTTHVHFETWAARQRPGWGRKKERSRSRAQGQTVFDNHLSWALSPFVFPFTHAIHCCLHSHTHSLQRVGVSVRAHSKLTPLAYSTRAYHAKFPHHAPHLSETPLTYYHHHA